MTAAPKDCRQKCTSNRYSHMQVNVHMTSAPELLWNARGQASKLVSQFGMLGIEWDFGLVKRALRSFFVQQSTTLPLKREV